MKNRWLMLMALLVSCGGGEQETSYDQTDDEIENVGPVVYESDLRPDIEEWDMNEVFTDTVLFVDFNDDGDYAFMTVETSTGKQLNMITGDYVDSEYLSGNQLIVDWKLDSLWEAGEGDELYFQERIISFRPFGDKIDFSEFLSRFAHEYAAKKDLSTYFHPELGSYEAFNPGAYCVLGDASEDVNGEFVDMESDHVLTDKKAEGDFCEGYSSGPGFYFEFIEEDNLPGYADMSGDQDFMKSITPELPEKYEKVAKVLVVNNGYFNRYWYFIKIDGSWYLWIEDYCDCSA